MPKLCSNFINLIYSTMHYNLLYFWRKYDCFGFANISWTKAIKFGIYPQMGKSKNHGFSNFEGKNQIKWVCYGHPYKLYFNICDYAKLLTSLLLMPHLYTPTHIYTHIYTQHICIHTCIHICIHICIPG